MKIKIREANDNDLAGLLQLYTQLHNNPFPDIDQNISCIWNDMLSNPQHHIIIGEAEGKIVSSCEVIIIKNLTHNQKPFALVENVITDEGFRGKGFASRILNFARDIAKADGCYKMMLMTGSRLESTLRFYERAGYNKNDKTGFIQWL